MRGKQKVIFCKTLTDSNQQRQQPTTREVAAATSHGNSSYRQQQQHQHQLKQQNGQKLIETFISVFVLSELFIFGQIAPSIQ